MHNLIMLLVIMLFIKINWVTFSTCSLGIPVPTITNHTHIWLTTPTIIDHTHILAWSLQMCSLRAWIYGMGIISNTVYCQTARRVIVPWKITAVGQPSFTFRHFFDAVVKSQWKEENLQEKSDSYPQCEECAAAGKEPIKRRVWPLLKSYFC